MEQYHPITIQVIRNYLLLLLLLTCNLIYGQGLHVGILSTSEGLSQGMVFDIIQTNDDYIWIATKDGLNRYDGYKFKVFNYELDNPYTISGNVITDLYQDSKGRFWVSTRDNGINLYDPKTEKFYHYKLPTGNGFPDYNDIINLISEDNEGNLWLGTRVTGVYKLTVDIPEKLDHPDLSSYVKAQYFSIPFKFIDNNDVKFIYHYDSDKTWIGTVRGLFQVENGIVTEVKISNIEENISGFSSMLRIDEKHLLFKTENAFILWKEGGESQTFFMDHNPIPLRTGLKLIDSADRIWLTNGWKNIYTIHKKDLLEGKFNPEKFHDLNNGAVSTIYEDKTGGIWIGTNGYGLLTYNPKQEYFNTQKRGKSIHGIQVDNKDRVWITSYSKSKHHEVIGDISNTMQSNLDFLNKRNRWKGLIHQVSSGEYWMLNPSDDDLTDSRLLHLDSVLNIKGEYGKNISQINDDLLVSNDDKFIWYISNNRNLVRFNIEDKTDESFDFVEALNLDQKIRANHIYEDHSGMIWLSTQIGLIMIDFQLPTPQARIYQEELGGSNKVFPVLSVADDPTKPTEYIWVGSYGLGLFLLNKKDGSIENYTTKNGLSNNTVYGILPDGKDLWLSTNKGLSKFNTIDRKFQNYYKSDGLQDNEFNTGVFCKGNNGDLIFGGVNGFNQFVPSELSKPYKVRGVASDYEPQIYITQLRINNKIVNHENSENLLSSPIHHTKSIKLDYQQNVVALEFSILDYLSTEQKEYKYRMKGVNDSWVIGNANKVNYILHSGHYIFEVYGKNSNGKWVNSPASLKITITPPWWKTNLAYIIYGFTFLGLVFAIYRNQTNRFKLRNKLAFEQEEAKRFQELDKVKSQFFSNITHEFRTPLTLIIEPVRQILKESNSKNLIPNLKLVEKNSLHLLNLVNQLLDLSKLEDNKMKLNLHQGNVLDTIWPILESFEVLANKKGVDVIIKAPFKIEAFDFDKKKISKIVYNLISNALKFTAKGGTVEVAIQRIDGFLEIKVVDSGIGIAKNEQEKIFNRFYQVDGTSTRKGEGTGIGLALTKELVELMNGEIKLHSKEAKGSTFTVRIPFLVSSKKALKEEDESILLEHTPFIDKSNLTSPLLSRQENLDAEDIVLLVEDNDELRGFIKQSLSHQYTIIEATNGREGIQMALKYLPNLVISDLMMPDKDGYEVCETLKTNEVTSHIPVIILTAKTALESKIKGLKYGADAYISKPFNTEEVLVRIENLIKIRKQLQEKYQSGMVSQPKIKEFSEFDTLFLQRMNDILEKNMGNETFGVNELCGKLKMSRSQLHRKIKALINQSVGEYIRNFRLEKAYDLFKDQSQSVMNVMVAVGFKHQSHFTKLFKEKFGKNPKDVWLD